MLFRNGGGAGGTAAENGHSDGAGERAKGNGVPRRDVLDIVHPVTGEGRQDLNCLPHLRLDDLLGRTDDSTALGRVGGGGGLAGLGRDAAPPIGGLTDSVGRYLADA